PWRDALAVTTRHPSPPALKNLFTAVCNATSCPRTIITITTDPLTARTRGKSGSFTRKRSLPAVDLSSRLSRRIIASFLPHCLSLLPSPLWCYRTLNFLPLPTKGEGTHKWSLKGSHPSEICCKAGGRAFSNRTRVQATHPRKNVWLL